MPVDPLVALASSIHAGSGTFALLLGSGISRSAEVPTGWDVAVDLLRRLAVLEGEDPGADPVAWYVERSGQHPDYSRILDELAPSPADRRNVLQPYFEPSADEREQGIKAPNAAHRAIGELVAAGHVRVIVTTNFDRLLERALVDAGVQPSVISSPPAAAGAIPLAHSRCTVLKVHGDYLSPDLKNTVEELGSYDPAIDALLDQIFDQYGLIVCGWSADWDTALCNAILRAPGRRYATFWCRMSPPSNAARQLVTHRSAIEVPISGADDFFTSLSSKVAALGEAMDQDPLSTALAVSELKRYVADPTHRIRLYDLVMNQVERLCGAVPPDQLGTNAPYPEADNVAGRMRLYESASATSLALLAQGGFFGNTEQHDELWVRAIRRVATRRLNHGGYELWVELQQYPTLLLVYGLGLGCLAAGRVEPLARVLATISVAEPNGDRPIGVAAASWTALNYQVCKELPGLERHRTPISQYLFELLREPVRPLLPIDGDYEIIFDVLEYLLGLVYASWQGGGFGPAGRWAWRQTGDRAAEFVMQFQDVWLGAGLFEGSRKQFEETRAEYDAAIRRHEVAW